MNLILAVFIALLPSFAAAAPSLESAAVGSLAAFETMALPHPSAASAALAHEPTVATMKGEFNGANLGLTLDRRDSTVVGGLNGMSVKIAVDNDARTVTGAVNGVAMKLAFAETPEGVSYKGAVNGSRVEYSIDWRNGVVDGFANGAKLHLEFDVAGGSVDRSKSTVNNAPATLTLDGSGNLTGTFGGKHVGLTLVNADLSDFISNLYLFLKP